MYTYKYPMAAVTVDAIVIEKQSDHILLIKRGNQPFKDMWALPGGFLEMDEPLEDSCRRELKEETGLEVGVLTQFKAFGTIGRDPRQRTVSVVFYTTIEAKTQIQGMDDATDAAWFPINNLPELAFDHRQILYEFIDFVSQN